LRHRSPQWRNKAIAPYEADATYLKNDGRGIGERVEPVAMTQIDRARLTRRHVLVGGLGVAAFGFGTVTRAQDTKPTFAYVGSYTKNPPGGGSNNPVGLSVFRLDPTNGALTLVQEVASANPSFVALDPTRRFLYVVNEIDDFEGQKAGSAEAYAINPATGEITLLNRQSVKGTIPAHLAVDPTGRYLIVANYVGGNFVVLPIESDGRLGPVVDEVIDKGHGPNVQRQASPHPHGITFDPAGRFLATADLGTDEIQIFQLANGKLVPISKASTAPGAGPRHIVFHPNGRVLFVINELNATVTSFAFDPDKGEIGRELQTISTEPPGYSGPKSTAEIAIDPSGKFLYASNRGHNSIVGYRIDPATGRLDVIGHAAEGIVFPRSFAIDPSGKWLYVANQKADTIVQFAIDPSTGELKPTGQVTRSITPVAIVFRPGG
jgi:6-phosphogluconolactonase